MKTECHNKLRPSNKLTLRDICERVDYGYTASSHKEPIGPKFLRITDIVPDLIDWESVPYCEIDDTDLEKYRLREGDIVVARTGATTGYAKRIKSQPESVFASYLVRVRIKPEHDNRYVGLVVESDEYKRFIKANLGGAAQPQANAQVLTSFPISLPALTTQRKIASMLLAYGDLIENNARRTRILEEIAGAIYREWFVEFRAPGVKLRKATREERELTRKDVFPEGWSVREMREVAEVIDCLHSKKPLEDSDGRGMLLQLFNIGERGKLDLSKRYLISEEDYQLWTSRIEVQAGDCVVTNVGRVGAVAQVPEDVKAALGRNMTGIRPKRDLLSPSYLLEYLLSPHMATEVNRKTDVGTIMDALNVKGIVRLRVLIPPSGLMEAFHGLVRPVHRRAELFMQQMSNLRRTRDFLLPKLISGEIGVEGLDIKTEQLESAVRV